MIAAEAAVTSELLLQVNGEKVSNWDIWTLSQKIPGPVDSPVLLRMKSGLEPFGCLLQSLKLV